MPRIFVFLQTFLATVPNSSCSPHCRAYCLALPRWTPVTEQHIKACFLGSSMPRIKFQCALSTCSPSPTHSVKENGMCGRAQQSPTCEVRERKKICTKNKRRCVTGLHAYPGERRGSLLCDVHTQAPVQNPREVQRSCEVFTSMKSRKKKVRSRINDQSIDDSAADAPQKVIFPARSRTTQCSRLEKQHSVSETANATRVCQASKQASKK